MYIDKLDDIINEYNNTYHSTVQMKLGDIESSTYIKFDVNIITKIINLKVVFIKEYKKYEKIFTKGCGPYCSEKVFKVKKVKNPAQSTYVVEDLNGKEIAGTFYEK